MTRNRRNKPIMARRQKSEGDRQPPKVQQIKADRTSEGMTLNEALNIFVEAKIAENLRERTIAEYYNHVRYLTDYLASVKGIVSPLLSDLTASNIRQYIKYLRDDRERYEGARGRKYSGKGLSISTINIRLRTLRTMCRFWHSEGIIDFNPMANIKPLRQDEAEEVPGLEDNEIRTILNSLDTRQYAQWRDKVLILLLLDTGLRINEALSLTIEQVDAKMSLIIVQSSIAKNRQFREVPLSREVLRMLLDLHAESSEYFGDVSNVFNNAYGEPFTPDAFRKRLERMRNRLKIPRLHPHMFRHTFARKYILNGGDVFTLQKILDHADIQTTRKYVQMETTHVRAQHNKFSPVRTLLN